jgi:hypothetical protein
LRRQRDERKIHGGCTGEDARRTDVEWQEVTALINVEWVRQKDRKERKYKKKKTCQTAVFDISQRWNE